MLLVGVSEDLFNGGRTVVARAAGDKVVLRLLIQFHLEFVLANPHVIEYGIAIWI